MDTLFWKWLLSIRQIISFACCSYLTRYFHILDSTVPILRRILVYKLCLHFLSSIFCDMPCGHRNDISQKCSTKSLTVSSYFCLFTKRVWTEISMSSSKKWYMNFFSTSDHDLIVPEGNYINHINADPLKILAKILVIIRSFPWGDLFVIRSSTSVDWENLFHRRIPPLEVCTFWEKEPILTLLGTIW